MRTYDCAATTVPLVKKASPVRYSVSAPANSSVPELSIRLVTVSVAPSRVSAAFGLIRTRLKRYVPEESVGSKSPARSITTSSVSTGARPRSQLSPSAQSAETPPVQTIVSPGSMTLENDQ